MPAREIHVTEISLVVQRGQPVNSVHRSRGQPVLEAILQCLCIERVVDAENFYAHSFQPLRQRVSYCQICPA